MFTKPTEGWTNMTQTAKLTASDGAYTDYFGNSVSISGENIVIGAYSDDDIGTNSGSAYVFTKPAGAWSTMTETIKLTASDAGENNQFGRSVNISGSKVVVGAPENLDGVAYLYLIGPVITSHPEDQLDINSGISVTFSTTADNVDSYQWQVSTDGGSNFTDIADNAIYTNSATTTLNVVTEKEMNNYQYRCVVSNEWISEPSNSALLTIKSTTAINDLSSQSFSVYPNPATDNLYIEFKENQSGIVQIYDVTGKIITEKNCTEQTEKINISEFANGMYIVKIQSGENVISYKIMKE